jgi:hypothetical protein
MSLFFASESERFSLNGVFDLQVPLALLGLRLQEQDQELLLLVAAEEAHLEHAGILAGLFRHQGVGAGEIGVLEPGHAVDALDDARDVRIRRGGEHGRAGDDQQDQADGD